jgi:large subunit ribosomal protein L7/L12
MMSSYYHHDNECRYRMMHTVSMYRQSSSNIEKDPVVTVAAATRASTAVWWQQRKYNLYRLHQQQKEISYLTVAGKQQQQQQQEQQRHCHTINNASIRRQWRSYVFSFSFVTRRNTSNVSVEADSLLSPPPPPPPTPSSTTNNIVWTTHLLSPESIAKVDAIFHKILWLDMVETHMLTSLINEKLGLPKLTTKQSNILERQLEIFTAQQQHGGGGGNGVDSSIRLHDDSDDVASAVSAPPPQVMELKLVGYDAASKIKVIKEVRAMKGLGLKEAKELVESIPTTIIKGLTPEKANALKAQLEAVNAQVELI